MFDGGEHPSLPCLAAFASGTLALPGIGAVEAHLGVCAACCAALDTIAVADGFVSGLRDAGLDAPPGETGPPARAANGRPGLPRVPGYDVVREVGRGGMGVVYEARQLALDRSVALKVMRAAATAGPAEQQRFRAEALALGRLHHPNVVQVYDTGTFDGQPYVALEFVAGGTLADRAGTPHPPCGAARWAAALCDGVAAAHAAGVLHRDLKPGNVLLVDGVPKITDFGLAKLLDDATSATVSGTVAGTPSYMAPEQARGHKDVGPAADVYALGTILYELLTGRPPFLGATALDTMEQVCSKDPVPPGRLQPATPRDLDTVVLKCLDKEPARRYASAAALGDDLRRFLDGRPVAARPVSVVTRAAKWARRRPVVAALGMALAIAVVGGVAGVGYQFVQTEAARCSAVAEGRRAQVNAAGLALDRGVREFQDGDVEAGLRSMADALDQLPAGEPDLEFAARVNFAAWRPRLARVRYTPPHGTAVTATAYSPDGRTLLTANWGNRGGEPSPGLAQLWDPGDLSRPRLTVEHPTSLRCAAWHPSGRTFAAGSIDGTVRFWDAASGSPVGLHLRHNGVAFAVAFSPDGTRLAVGVLRHEPGNVRQSIGGAVAVYAYPGGEPLGPPVEAPFAVRSVAWHPSGERLAAGGAADLTAEARTGAAAVFDATPVRQRGPLLYHAEPVRVVVFAPDGTLATGAEDGAVRFWASDGHSRPQPLRHPMPVNSIAFARGGSLVVTGCGTPLPNNRYAGPGEVRAWDAATGEAAGPPLAMTQRGLCNMVHAAAVSPDGTRVAAASENGRVWSAPLPPAQPALAAGTLPREAVLHFSPDGSILAAVVCAPRAHNYEFLPAELVLLDAATLRPLGSAALPFRQRPRFRPDGRRALLVPEVTDRLGVQLIDVPSGASVRLPDELAGEAAWANWFDGGRAIATVDMDGTLRRWDTDTFAPRGGPTPGVGRVAAASPDGRWLVASAGPATTLWSVVDGRRVDLVPRPEGPLVRADFAAGGATLMTAHRAGANCVTVQAWTLPGVEPLGRPLEVPEFNRAAPTPDGRGLVLLRSTYEMPVVAGIVDPRTGARLSAQVPVGIEPVISPDGRVLATPSWSDVPRVRLWGWAGKPLGPPLPHPGRVESLAFSPDGWRLATCDTAGGVRLWAVPSPAVGTPADLRSMLES